MHIFPIARCTPDAHVSDARTPKGLLDCRDLYGILEECLGDHERDWRRCQAELEAFKRCRLGLREGRAGEGDRGGDLGSGQSDEGKVSLEAKED